MTASMILASLWVSAVKQPAFADEVYAKSILKAMSDYIASETSLVFTYDSSLDVVTDDGQILSIAASGEVVLTRPDHLYATRTGGFTDLAMMFDGTELTIVGKNADAYTTVSYSGSVDELIDSLHNDYGFPLPGADVLLSDAYTALMDGVTDIKDLGAGVIGGAVCDHLAFRTELVDWQIFVAQGDQPLPCRYVITSKDIPGAPRYQIDFFDWSAGDSDPDVTFTFDASDGAKSVSIEELRSIAGALPPQFTLGAE